MSENPDRELIFMYPNEGSDHTFTMGELSNIIIDDYYVDDERVWLRNREEEELHDYIADRLADDRYTKFPLSDEQEKIINDQAKIEIEKLEWKEAIVVYINY